jgi:hypothetical protein
MRNDTSGMSGRSFCHSRATGNRTDLVPQGLRVAQDVSVCVRTEKEPQISPLRYPGFPVEIGDAGELHAAMSSAARQEIRVRSGRDDKFVGPYTAVRRLDKQAISL